MRLGPMELVIILVIALIIFGPGKLPQVGRALGKGMRDFKEALSGGGADRSSASDKTGTDQPS
ncbi:MAG TPA: twin-arginine translocase TatA/TatE family subunit [Limnochorda sp.]